MANTKAFTANNYNILFEARRISSGFKFINDYLVLLSQLDSVCRDQSSLGKKRMKNEEKQTNTSSFQKSALCI